MLRKTPLKRIRPCKLSKLTQILFAVSAEILWSWFQAMWSKDRKMIKAILSHRKLRFIWQIIESGAMSVKRISAQSVMLSPITLEKHAIKTMLLLADFVRGRSKSHHPVWSLHLETFVEILSALISCSNLVTNFFLVAIPAVEASVRNSACLVLSQLVRKKWMRG